MKTGTVSAPESKVKDFVVTWQTQTPAALNLINTYVPTGWRNQGTSSSSRSCTMLSVHSIMEVATAQEAKMPNNEEFRHRLERLCQFANMA